MSEKPIIFSAPMVRALLAGKKSQTRRALKPQPHLLSDGGSSYIGEDGKGRKLRIDVGDLLWVREQWSGHRHFRGVAPIDRVSFSTPDGPVLMDDIWFWADGNPESGDYERPRPSIHMPRYASRITLSVTDVRVQRLQDIGEEDALAEGVPDDWHYTGSGDEEYCSNCRGFGVHAALGAGYGVTEVDCSECETARLRYRNLWEHINGLGSWAANPWVAAYTFDVHHCNISKMTEAAGEVREIA